MPVAGARRRADGRPRDAGGGSGGGFLVPLEDARATSAEMTGAKAAALATASRAGLPVLPGLVITTAATASGPDDLEPVIDMAWQRVSEFHSWTSVVVRSSSTVEDTASSSMAGMFTSVLDVRSRADFGSAVRTVIDSARSGAAAIGAEAAPMAVLVQPYLPAQAGGVLFGIDPVGGRQDRMVVAASSEGPAAVVGGTVDTTRYSMSRRGHAGRDGVKGDALLTSRKLHALARLARRAERTFGGPQDIEWALGPDRPSEGDAGTLPDGPLRVRLWLLQSRPITAVGDAGAAAGPVLGPGPLAETFPDPLSRLEQELWVEPLRKALVHALALAGTISRHRLAASPIVTCVDGRPAVDLDLLGVGGSPSLWRRLDPRPRLRRLVAAWRVGRLRAALPGLATDLLAHTDSDLLALPATGDMTDGQLLRLLGRSGQALTALHGHEVLMGWLVEPGAPTVTAASVALRSLHDGRRQGLSDAEIVYHHPSVLALVAPRISGSAPALPPAGGLVAGAATASLSTAEGAGGSGTLREALRLRIRWLQELTAVAAWALGDRLAQRGVLGDPEDVRHLSLDELRGAIRTGDCPAGLDHRRLPEAVPPLPTRFRLTPAGEVVAVGDPGSRGGVGAGGGRRVGTVSGDGDVSDGDVLVVRALEPQLAVHLPRLAGLVAETGSPLSHLAILARELGVAIAVDVHEAVKRFPPGSTVVVNGATGEVDLLEDGAVTP